MDLLASLVYGFTVTLAPANLFACFVGVFVGTLIGVLPGIGPVATMSLLLPVTYALSPTASIIGSMRPDVDGCSMSLTCATSGF